MAVKGSCGSPWSVEAPSFARDGCLAARKWCHQTIEQSQADRKCGFDYWSNSLLLARQIAGDSPLRPVLKTIAKRIAFIQAFPYHSKSFGAQRILEKMPSLNEPRSFVNDELLQRARSGDALIIVLRGGEKLWGIKRGHPNVVI